MFILFIMASSDAVGDRVIVESGVAGFVDDGIVVVPWPRRGVSPSPEDPFGHVRGVLFRRLLAPCARSVDGMRGSRCAVSVRRTFRGYTSGAWNPSECVAVDVRRLLLTASCTSYHRRFLEICFVDFSVRLRKENVGCNVTWHGYALAAVKGLVFGFMSPFVGGEVVLDVSDGLYYLAYYGRCLVGDDMELLYEVVLTACVDHCRISLCPPLSPLDALNGCNGCDLGYVSPDPPPRRRDGGDDAGCLYKVRALRRWLVRQFPEVYERACEGLNVTEVYV